MSGVLAMALGWIAAASGGALAVVLIQRIRQERENVVRAAHELRGSLAAIALGLELEPAGWRRRALELEVARAARALDDLCRPPVVLDSNLGAQRLEQLHVAALVHECVEAARARAERAEVKLAWDWEGPDVTVWGDRVRLSQALGNLIANAIEHGGGSVVVRGRSAPAHGGVRIEVADSGPGLPAPVADLVRGARAGRGQRGRGLAIACAIAAQHGGRIAGAPAARGGRLVLELPVAAVPVHAAPRE